MLNSDKESLCFPLPPTKKIRTRTKSKKLTYQLTNEKDNKTQNKHTHRKTNENKAMENLRVE